LSVDVLVTKGISRRTLNLLHDQSVLNVEDLKDLDTTTIQGMPLDAEEKKALRQIVQEVITEIAQARGEAPVKNTFIHFDQRQPSLDEALDTKPTAASCPPALAVPVGALPPGCPTVGSVAHRSGECLPCAWHHGDEGCRHGASCIFCHLCPAGEIKRRKKVKRKLFRAVAGPPTGTPPTIVAGPPQAAYPTPFGYVSSFFRR
jgi:hypothetical protein